MSTTNDLSRAELAMALHQAINNTKFRSKNLHLSEDEYKNLLLPDPIFPRDKPVSSPYKPAKAKGDYTQIRFKGKKHYLH
ncbi:hypothetical protein EV182_001725, partial [Spiromyces aspiralis]